MVIYHRADDVNEFIQLNTIKCPLFIQSYFATSLISSYSGANLIVVDKIADNYFTIRILESVENQKELLREEIKRDYSFDLYFSYFPTDLKREALIVLEKDKPQLVGFLYRDSNGFKVIWKS
jgi:hypothetical protein